MSGPAQVWQITLKRGVVRLQAEVTHFKFSDTNDISVTAEAAESVVKFRTDLHYNLGMTNHP